MQDMTLPKRSLSNDSPSMMIDLDEELKELKKQIPGFPPLDQIVFSPSRFLSRESLLSQLNKEK